MLAKIRALLAKAEDPGATPPEAEALTAKAVELMGKYGIDQARLNAARPGSDLVANRKIDIENPWAMVRIHLLNGIFTAMRCKVIQLTHPGEGARVHVFGYQSDMDRAELLYTSLLVQMARALAAQRVPVSGGHAKRWRRSWMLGFISTVTSRVEAAEQQAATQADTGQQATAGPSTALVLRDRSLAVQSAFRQEYPRTRTAAVRCGASGYANGQAAGQRADIGGARVHAGSTPAIGR
ncbi:MAG: DUF2786 domain-containing protein [Chloroflexota bacterium]|nr:DUF2786 domain-containing protein [Chloroflexota bacterium]